MRVASDGLQVPLSGTDVSQATGFASVSLRQRRVAVDLGLACAQILTTAVFDFSVIFPEY